MPRHARRDSAGRHGWHGTDGRPWRRHAPAESGGTVAGARRGPADLPEDGAVLPYPGRPLRWLTIAVSNSDSSTLKSRESAGGGRNAAHVTLDALGPGAQGQVVRIDPALQAELMQHGLIEGTVVRLESRAPFGGPVVLSIGRARLAIGRTLARAIRVERIA